MVGMAMAVVLGTSCSHSKRPGVALVHNDAPPSGAVAGSLEGRVVAGINRFRTTEGLAPLAPHAGLELLALEHSREMARSRDLSHDGFRGRSTAGEGRYGLVWMTENVMWGVGYEEAGLPERIVQDWIDSPGHRKNLLRANEYIGIGVARDPDGSVWATQLSARN